MSRILILLSLVACFAAPPAKAETRVRRLVLAAGANNGGIDRPLLRYAVSDAESFVRVLEEMGGVDPADVLLLRDPDLEAYRSGLVELQRRVLAAKRRGDRLEVLLYYSGHADEEGLLLAGDHLDYMRLRNELRAANADVHIAVLDACASGAITRTKGGRHHQPFLLDESFDMRGYAFLTSSSMDEVAQESDKIEASFFTHYLVSGLRGAADINGDRRVMLNEVYQFAFSETLARTTGTIGGAQHPAYDIMMKGTGDVVMTQLDTNSAHLFLTEPVEGRVYIHTVGRKLVAELHKPAGRVVELGLEPGRYTVLLEGQAGLQRAELVLTESEQVGVRNEDFRTLAPEDAVLRGGQRQRLTIGLNEDRHIEIATSEGYILSLGSLSNTKTKAFRGVQFAWLVNQAHQRAGAQISAVGNLALKEVDGWQVAGVVNWAMGPVQGWQVAGLNIASQVRGWQIAGSSNIVGKIRGWQVAGASNYASEVKGGQLGWINRAEKIKGWQFGLVNISGDIKEGWPVGLINYSRSGLFNIRIWYDELGMNLFTLSSGSRSFYTSFTSGFTASDEGQRIWALGFGLGWQKGWRRSFLNLDLNQYRITRNYHRDYNIGLEGRPPRLDFDFGKSKINNYLTRAKVELGLDLNGRAWLSPVIFPGTTRLLLFGGFSLNNLWTDGHSPLVKPVNGNPQSSENDHVRWPGFHFGLRYGR